MTDNLSWLPLQLQDNTTGHEYVLRDELRKRIEESNRKQPILMNAPPVTIAFPIGSLTPESLDAIRQIMREELQRLLHPEQTPAEGSHNEH